MGRNWHGQLRALRKTRRYIWERLWSINQSQQRWSTGQKTRAECVCVPRRWNVDQSVRLQVQAWMLGVAGGERGKHPASREMHLREPQPSHLYAMHRRRAVCMCISLARHLHDCCNTAALLARCKVASRPPLFVSHGNRSAICILMHRARITLKCIIFALPLTAHACMNLNRIEIKGLSETLMSYVKRAGNFIWRDEENSKVTPSDIRIKYLATTTNLHLLECNTFCVDKKTPQKSDLCDTEHQEMKTHWTLRWNKKLPCQRSNHHSPSRWQAR